MHMCTMGTHSRPFATEPLGGVFETMKLPTHAFVFFSRIHHRRIRRVAQIGHGGVPSAKDFFFQIGRLHQETDCIRVYVKKCCNFWHVLTSYMT